MRAAFLTEPGRLLTVEQADIPVPKPGELLIRVRACGICRTDLHIVDGDLPSPELPRIPGHQIVGEVAQSTVTDFHPGQRVGVPWLGSTCGACEYCSTARENLCDSAGFTGYDVDGGFAEYCVANARYCFPIDSSLSDLQAAPLLCAGMIGFRAFRMTGDSDKLGFFGFGSAAHILVQVALYQNKDVYAITRPGDTSTQQFARTLGARWSGGTDENIPVKLDAAIIFAPAGELVPLALGSVRKGGIVICAGIHMSDIPSFQYEKLWQERIIRSVANLTRDDGDSFMKLACAVQIKTTVKSYALEDVNDALDDLRSGRINGSAVIEI
ncbi:MAG: zinc-dependent alcohol dehydrogenase family protein [Acidiferrobacterales bacterium]|nr:zinc-dependent alcohol dehydrogenase family protein [Acidiferrobacterales bacterium]